MPEVTIEQLTETGAIYSIKISEEDTRKFEVFDIHLAGAGEPDEDNNCEVGVDYKIRMVEGEINQEIEAASLQIVQDVVEFLAQQSQGGQAH